MRTAGSNRLPGRAAGNELRTRKKYVSDRDARFKQPSERCKLLTRWAFDSSIFEATRRADSAYDKETVYKAIEAHSPGRRTRVVIPPQRNATIPVKEKRCMVPQAQTRPRHGDRKGEPYIMGKVLPSQRLLKQFEEQLVFGEMNLSEIVRSGAQMMLQYALEREVTEALGRNYYENAPATTKEKGRRNGYESHRVLTGEGAVTVQVPQVRETEKVFQSKILDAYVSRTEKLDELIARMYVHGMSTRDIEATFADVLSGTGVSKSVVSRVTRCLSVSRRFENGISRTRSCCISSSTARTCATTKERRGKSPSSLRPAIALMGREFFFISVSATENPTRTGRGSCRRWWPEE